MYLALPLAFPKGEDTLAGMLFLRASEVYITAATMRLLYVFLGGLKTAADASNKLSQHYVSSFIQLGKLIVTASASSSSSVSSSTARPTRC